MSERILVFEMEIPIRWGDMDALDHVNNTVYFRYMEQMRISWFDQLGGYEAALADEGPLVINASCTFLRQLKYPGTVLGRQYIGSIGRSSFMIHADMMRTDDPQTVYAQGSAKMVWANYDKRASAPLPEHIRRMIVTPLAR